MENYSPIPGDCKSAGTIKYIQPKMLSVLYLFGKKY